MGVEMLLDLPVDLRWLMKTAISILYFITRVYFCIVNASFSLYNLFVPRLSVVPTNEELLTISATQAAKAIRDKEITSSELLEAYIKRIEEVNPIINAVVLRNFQEARRKAAEADAEVAQADEQALDEIESRRPLLGVPFTIKDCIEVEGLRLTCGVYHRRNTVGSKNAVVVDRMLTAGAICLAVTNVPEVCMWWESSNTLFGRTRNPYDSRRIAGGSSGGEAALIAAAGSLIGVGSDIGGSIRMPAFFNGVFGLKPTPGVIPLEGHHPEAVGYRQQMLRIGPICRYANDLTLMYKVLGGQRVVDELRIDEPTKMKQLRVFYMDGINMPLVEAASGAMTKTLRRSVRYLELKYDLAAVRIDLPLLHRAIELFIGAMHVEGAPKFHELLSDATDGINIPKEAGKWLIGQSPHTFPALLVAVVDAAPKLSDLQYAQLKKMRERLQREISDLLGEDGVLLFPSFARTAPFHNQPIFTPLNFAFTGIFNAIALPVVQCPMGLGGDGLPLGVQVVGAPNSDRNLIAIAKDLEEGFGGWQQSVF